MKCSVCDKTIEYEGGVEFFVVSRQEMAWGDQSIYPFETQKEIMCSVGCIDVYLYRNKEKP